MTRVATIRNFLTSPIFQQSLITTIFLTILLTIIYLGVTTLPIVLFLMYVIAFFIGLLFIPLFAYTIGPSTGPIAEAIANLLWIVSNLSLRRPVLYQTETDEYKLIRGDPDTGPQSHWSRWAMAPFGVSFEPTREAFSDVVVPTSITNQIKNFVYAEDETTTDIDIERGGHKSYVSEDDKKIAENDGVLVLIGEALSEVRHAAGQAIGLRAYSSGLEQYGGDTSGASNRTRLLGSIVFVVLGLGMGYVVFF